ncbi:hypothetical protein Dimus_007949, partial [Dionaea muscipula]
MGMSTEGCPQGWLAAPDTRYPRALHAVPVGLAAPCMLVATLLASRAMNAGREFALAKLWWMRGE